MWKNYNKQKTKCIPTVCAKEADKEDHDSVASLKDSFKEMGWRDDFVACSTGCSSINTACTWCTDIYSGKH